MKSDSLISSFKYALCGIKKAFKSERNLKVHSLAVIVVIIAGLLLEIDKSDWVAIVIFFALVIGSELINTAIEEVVNLLSPEIRQHAKYAKDIAAGSVLVFAISSVIGAILIFGPKIMALL